MAPRPKDVAAVAELLMDEHEDVTELAKAVIERLDSVRAERPFYVAAVGSAEATWAYGPLSTPKQAERALAAVGSTGYVTGPLRVYPLSRLTEGDGLARRVCGTCGHPAETHNFPRSRVRGCVVGEIKRGERIVREACKCEELT